MASNLNSSSSIERFMLANGESKVYQNVHPGGNQWSIDIHGDEGINDPTLVPITTTLPSASFVLQKAEDGVTWSTVSTTVVVAGGQVAIAGSTGAYTKLLNNGPGPVHVVAKPLNAVQGVPQI